MSYDNAVARLHVPANDYSVTLIDGNTVDLVTGELYLLITVEEVPSYTLLNAYCVPLVVYGSYNQTHTVLDSTFRLYLDATQNYFVFVAGSQLSGCCFSIETEAFKKFPSYVPDDVGSSDNGVGSSEGVFSVPDLDGNFGAYPNGSVVTVSARQGEYTIEASQQLWSYPAVDLQGSSVIYKLSQNGKILLAPHFLLTLKDS
ncbi:hypothetical protein [Sulfurospirillum diekertiae]|uniref:Uncharacterized protein n=1 Tax=Sulfurospirillum diekertiae TaxID=1854492 RepID=A0A1Y0HL43_9BACT|nr:hypothetical protein [Sulfurospirillum diekertiae]ARU48316.1 hypothetical protein Sdiek1_1150 [Sulfurospirillum diekertiae]ASC93154.1 hypothetical protein Sdiek2_1133 [Sulfurospirillum diekertiae]